MQYPEIDVSPAGPTMQEGLNRQASVLAGLTILAAVGFAFASLASWNVNDPSLSVSNSQPVQNWLGYPGAVFADLTIQFLGLGSAFLLVPPTLWGWSRILQRPVTSLKNRLIQFPLAGIFVSATLACISVPQSWPLPLGLGGVIGDMMLKLSGAVGIPTSGAGAAILFAIFGITGSWMLLVSAGIIRIGANKQTDAHVNPESLADDTYDGDDEPSWLLGAVSHYWYAWFGSKLPSKTKHVAAQQPDDKNPGIDTGIRNKFTQISNRIRKAARKLLEPEEDGLGDLVARERATGNLINGDAGTDAVGIPEETGTHDLPPVTSYGENFYDNEPEAPSLDDDWREQPAPQPSLPIAGVSDAAPANSSGRVQASAPPPAPSKRLSREAQPSLIAGDEFELPTLHFLQEPPVNAKQNKLSSESLEQNARMLESVLQDFGVKGEIINVRPGPVVTLYELEPAPGIKSSRVIGLADDIARSMSAIAARVAVVPGRNAIGIELPNSNRETVYIREILASTVYESAKAKLPLILGKTIGGEATVADLAKMPHLLVAGTTGSGKSVAINTIILSLLYRFSPEQVKLIMIDPKMLELSIYDGIPHLLTPVVTDPKKAVVALKWTVREMEERYKKMSKIGVRNIDGFNTRVAEANKKGEEITRTIQTGFDRETGEAIYETETMNLEKMPYIVVIIDEMADLMMVAGKDIEGAIQRLAQMARAAGIHVIMATQRPSTDVITGTIKANFPTRISFQVTSKIDSRVMLGESGAEQLLGMGDMLYMAGGGRIQRLHGPFVADEEVDKVVNHLKTQGVPQYLDSVTEEVEEEGGDDSVTGTGDLSESNDIYDQAVAVVLRDRKVSTSYIQRRLAIGYNRAASLIERMEQEGLISAANHAGKREILVPAEDETI